MVATITDYELEEGEILENTIGLDNTVESEPIPNQNERAMLQKYQDQLDKFGYIDKTTISRNHHVLIVREKGKPPQVRILKVKISTTTDQEFKEEEECRCAICVSMKFEEHKENYEEPEITQLRIFNAQSASPRSLITAPPEGGVLNVQRSTNYGYCIPWICH